MEKEGFIMNDEERKAKKEELKKRIDEMTDEELDNVSAGMITFDPFWEFLEKNGISKYKLIKDGIITQTELTRMHYHGDNFSFKFINKLCKELNCNVSDVIAYVDEPEE